MTYLTTNNIRAILSEIGSTKDAHTVSVFKTVLAAVAANAATTSEDGGFIGFTPWSAGQWGSSYIMDLNPIAGVPALAFSEGIQPLLTPLGGR